MLDIRDFRDLLHFTGAKMGFAPATIILMSLATMFLQTAIPPFSDVVSPIERLTLLGALVTAVRVLWVSNARKDAQNFAMSAEVTKAMVEVLAAVKELRTATEEVGAAMDNVASNIAALASQIEENHRRK